MDQERISSPTKGTTPAFVYGIVEDGIVALPQRTLESLAEDWNLARSVETWGELRSRATPQLVERAHEIKVEWGEPLPSNNDALDPMRDLPGFADGQWPAWPMSLMCEELPSVIRNRIGRGGTSLLSGDYYEIEVSELAALAEAFASAGIPAIRDDRLVAAASGM